MKRIIQRDAAQHTSRNLQEQHLQLGLITYQLFYIVRIRLKSKSKYRRSSCYALKPYVMAYSNVPCMLSWNVSDQTNGLRIGVIRITVPEEASLVASTARNILAVK